MGFIHGNNFMESRLVKRCLETFYGIGPLVSQRIMARHYIHPACRVGGLAPQQILELNADLASLKIENELRREMRDNIRRLRDMGAYRGKRHALNLPVRGQNTRTQNATARRLNRMERYA